MKPRKPTNAFIHIVNSYVGCNVITIEEGDALLAWYPVAFETAKKVGLGRPAVPDHIQTIQEKIYEAERFQRELECRLQNDPSYGHYESIHDS